MSECQAGSIRISIDFLGINPDPGDSGKELCGAVLESVGFVDGLVGSIQRLPRHYEIHFVPWGTRYSKSTLSWHPFGTLRFVVAAYWFPNHVRRSKAYVLNTAAHETAHLWANVESIRTKNDQAEEEMAYTAGTCAQLHVEGRVNEEDLSWIEPAGTTGEMRISSITGVRQSQTIESLFEDGALKLDSKQGEAYSELCQAQVRAYFEGQGR